MSEHSGVYEITIMRLSRGYMIAYYNVDKGYYTREAFIKESEAMARIKELFKEDE